jgi:cytochrome c-type biogenesis protein CcmH
VRRLLLALAAVALVAAPSVAAAASCQKTTVADLEDEVMCPVCGTSLGLARESALARRERAFIAKRIASCQSKDEIKAALVAEFGPAVLAEPPRSGFSVSAYLVPVGGGLAALLAVALALLRWRRVATRDGAAPAAARRRALAPEAARRIDLELDELR